MKIKVERLGENEYLVVVPEEYKNSAASISAISKAMDIDKPAAWHIREECFLENATVVEI